MQQLSSTGRRILDGISERYGISQDAAEVLIAALVAGGGSQAQFSHPDLGGMGQWSAGGMIMVGDMFNNDLKHRVDGFLSELATALRGGDLFEPAAEGRRDGREGAGLFAPGGGFAASSWPDELGTPSTSGAQNDLHYAYFPDSRRLAIRKGGHITLYDTADHAIGGVSQQQSGDQSLTFTSQYGTVRLDTLRRVAGGDDQPPQPLAAEPSSPRETPATATGSPSRPEEGDVVGLIERLATLRDRGILSDEEFAAKKAELLARL
ncbi:Short C-terminal domain-containing protein [Kaistia soli DSM 19436]|uniref:Short C-terminal domain-containing protein n=1 Tax=Kaistia soli DSM 19436 TaxID=1122133 RepID=A0A1M5GLH8_9HYPH|nr:SHOCT domain-containing protein [Kaistia soli]SHG04548.1 Short C-terminal domain-containing protein [Kaistia soli DSM 19436]